MNLWRRPVKKLYGDSDSFVLYRCTYQADFVYAHDELFATEKKNCNKIK